MSSFEGEANHVPFHRRPFLLSAGTTEPWASAGMQLDLFLAERLQVRPVNCVLAVSAQDGKGAFAVMPMPPAIIRAQLTSLENAEIAAVRIGAMHTIEHVGELGDFLRRRPLPTVLDPVIATSAGGRFIDNTVLEFMRMQLFPHVTLITPNLDEAEMILGRSVRTRVEMENAVHALAQMGVQSVLLKGGHLSGAPVDMLWDGKRLHHFEATRIPLMMRGTGCALAIACAARLAYGSPLHQAVQNARNVVRDLLHTSREVAHMRIAP